MNMTDELWEAFGFRKDFGWNTNGWTHKQDPEIRFFEGVGMGLLGNKEPKTIEELLSILHKYWEHKYKERGKKDLQYNLCSLLGLE